MYCLARGLFWWIAPPNPDESYYWLWGQHPDLSYHDHPPLSAWIQGAFTALFGNSQFVLRLPTLATTIGTLCLYRAIIRQLYRTHVATRSSMVVATVLASPLMFIFMAFAWHDHLLIFLCITACHYSVRFLAETAEQKHGRTSDLLIAATATGLAGLTKYNAIFIATGIALVVLVRRDLRPVLRDIRVYLGIALCACIVSPVLIWNMHHGQRSFQFHLVDRLGGESLHFNPYPIIPFILLTIALLSPFQVFRIFCFRRWRWDRFRTYGHVYVSTAASVFLTSTIMFASMSILTGVRAYWNIVAYLMLFPLAVGAWHRRRFLVAEQIYGIGFAALFAIHYAILPLSTLMDDQGDKDTRMVLGWPQVAAQVRRVIEDDPGAVDFLVTSDYRSASALAFEMNDPNVTAFSKRTDQFDVWERRHDRTALNALVITDDWYPLGPTITKHFAAVEYLKTVPVLRFGIWIKAYDLYRGIHYLDRDPAEISVVEPAPEQ